MAPVRPTWAVYTFASFCNIAWERSPLHCRRLGRSRRRCLWTGWCVLASTDFSTQGALHHMIPSVFAPETAPHTFSQKFIMPRIRGRANLLPKRSSKTMDGKFCSGSTAAVETATANVHRRTKVSSSVWRGAIRPEPRPMGSMHRALCRPRVPVILGTLQSSPVDYLGPKSKATTTENVSFTPSTSK